MAEQIAELQIAKTSPQCISYRLIVAGRTVWSNRVFDVPEGHTGAKVRIKAWADAHGLRIVAPPQRKAG